MITEVSFFNGINPKLTKNLPISQVLNEIKNGTYKAKIEWLRSLSREEISGGKASYSEFKKALPGVTFAGTFKYRNGKNIQNYSGYMILDVDHVKDLTMKKVEICQDKHTAFCFISPGGDGLKIGIRINPKKWEKTFKTAEKYFLEKHGLKLDPANKDIARLCFISYDPELFINQNPEIFQAVEEKTRANNKTKLCDSVNFISEPRKKYCLEALNNACHKISTAPQGTRNVTTNKESFGIGQLVAAGGLTRLEAENALVEVASLCGLPSKEAETAVKSGLNAGAKEPRDLSKIVEKENLGFAKIIEQGKAAQKSLDDILIPARDTDKGNADRFQAVFEGKAMHTPEMGWLIWNEKYWKADERGVRDMFKYAISEEIHKEIEKTNQNRDKTSVELIGKLSKWLKQSQTAKIISSGLQWANSDACFRGYIDDFDKDIYLLNVENGTINLKTGELKPHDSKNKITKISNIFYDKNAACPIWKAFLNRIFEEKQDLIQFIQKAIGYTLTGDIKEQCWFFLHGTGQNGKSTFVEVISKLLGKYCKKADIKTFSEKQFDESINTPELAEFPGKRFVFATETKQGKAFDVGRIKDWTGGELIPACQKYKTPFNFFPHFKLWIAGNHKPIIKDSTLSTWRRIRFIPFNVTISDQEKDENLYLKLEAELSGILNWAIQGCLIWQTEKLKPPKEVIEATAEYQESQDRLSPFIKGVCITGKRYFIPFKTLYETYIAYCEANNDTLMSKPAFQEAIQERGFRTRRGHAHVVFVDGLSIISS